MFLGRDWRRHNSSSWFHNTPCKPVAMHFKVLYLISISVLLFPVAMHFKVFYLIWIRVLFLFFPDKFSSLEDTQKPVQLIVQRGNSDTKIVPKLPEEFLFWNCHIWTKGSSMLPKHSRTSNFFFCFPLWHVPKFG